MRTLSEIIEAAKSNEVVANEECIYAICAMSGLSTFDTMDLMKMAQDEKEGKPNLRAWHRYEESFRRRKMALGKSPKEWLGLSHDPANPEYQKRRGLANRVFDAALDGSLAKITERLKQDAEDKATEARSNR